MMQETDEILGQAMRRYHLDVSFYHTVNTAVAMALADKPVQEFDEVWNRATMAACLALHISQRPGGFIEVKHEITPEQAQGVKMAFGIVDNDEGYTSLNQTCLECNGTGTVVYSKPVIHASNPNLDTWKIMTETCSCKKTNVETELF